jgi:hypothetical protein
MNRRHPRGERRCTCYTVQKACWIGTVGWTDGPHSSCVGRVAELKPRRQKHQMNRRSIGLNHRSIRWPSLNKTETRQDEPFSTGWTDALVKRKHRSIRRPRSSIQRRFGRKVFNTGWTDIPSVYSIGTVVSAEVQRLSDMEGTGWTDTLEKHSIGSSDATFFREPLANG